MTFKAVKITDDVYWVGVIDWSLRNFHGYETGRGTTYNAYLVMADKITLVDTVKKTYKREFLSRISSIIDPGKIDYIISNHSEMDHSGLLPEIIQMVKPEKVFASEMGVKALTEHFHFKDGMLTAVKPGEEIDLGNKKLQFIDARMLHWPDSICSYLPDEKLIFSQDVFGMHLATNQRFADEVDPCILEYEAAKYYANIIMPLSHLVPKFAERLKDYPVEIVACDHGPIWRSKGQIEWIIGLYAKWAAMKPVRKAVIVYDTMWESSPVMASAICEGLTEGGIECKVMPLSGSHRSDIATELLDAGALIVGSPTLNNNIYPSLADVLYYLKGLKPKNLLGAVFSSYGWSGEAHKQLQDFLTEMKVEMVSEGVKSRYVPDDKALKECFDLGTEIAAKLKEIC